jgi:Ca2+-transporting ATPase
MGVDVAYQGFMISVLTLGSYFIGHFMQFGVWEVTNSADGTTMAFLTMSMAEIFHSFNMRSQRSSLFKLGGINRALNWAAIGSLIATTAVIEIPFLANAFGFTTIGFGEYAVALGLAACTIPIVELVKLIQRRAAKRK